MIQLETIYWEREREGGREKERERERERHPPPVKKASKAYNHPLTATLKLYR